MSSMEAPHQNEEELDSVELEELIRGFLSKKRYLHEFRLQKLVYIAELVATLEHGDRLTDADYKPYMYGTYSEDLRNSLNEMESELSTEPDLQYGKVTTKYLSCDAPELDKKVEKIINRVDNATSGWSSEDLGDWSKESWLYENTQYGDSMDFDRVHPARKSVVTELQETFPDLELNLEEDNS